MQKNKRINKNRPFPLLEKEGSIGVYFFAFYMNSSKNDFPKRTQRYEVNPGSTMNI